VAKWLSEEEGIAAFVLQYRLGPDGSGWPGRGGREGGRKRGREGWGEEGICTLLSAYLSFSLSFCLLLRLFNQIPPPGSASGRSSEPEKSARNGSRALPRRSATAGGGYREGTQARKGRDGRHGLLRG